MRKRKIKEKYLTEGWYDWIRANDLKEGDELRFQMDFDPSVVQVEIVRAKKHNSRK
ncbi:hypothetical protein A2U01_0027795 [Trifolium medium]|uniref:TF-B3 domain-containing protein n=1 Tax=Trifolium medium TaxID=97028 RepID=A0A392P780_9FABA|nr:hypothetical protein [Trifolium medium]